MITLKQAYLRCRDTLKINGFDAPEFEAHTLVEAATGFDRTKLTVNGNAELSADKEQTLIAYTQKRLLHIPLQYIIGSWSFCGFDFYVGDGVLIPRDDTEVLVGLCKKFLQNRPNKKTIDLCAGSGAISVALNKLCNADVTAVELSDKAFIFLQKNIQLNNADISLVNGDVFECHKDFDDGQYDLIVSNPPYIKRSELSTLQKEVQFEPKMALDGGETGFDFYEAIIRLWSSKLVYGGALAFELGEGQAGYVKSLMKSAGFSNIRTENDFGGTQRAIIGTMINN